MRKCSHCGNEFNDEEVAYVDEDVSKSACSLCLTKLIDDGEVKECADCNSAVSIDNSRLIGNDFGSYSVCVSCYDSDYFCCDGCGYNLHNDNYNGDGYCNDCVGHEDNDEAIQMRNPNLKTTKFQSADAGDIIKSNIKFGIELEVINESTENARNGLNEIAPDWGIEHDGSLRGSNALEIVSPILQGKAGEDAIKKTLKTLNDHKFGVNDTCGFHIHLEANDLIETENVLLSTESELGGSFGGRVKKSMRFNREALKLLGVSATKDSIRRFDDMLTRTIRHLGIRSSFEHNSDKNNVLDIHTDGRTVFFDRSGSDSWYVYAFTKEHEAKLEKTFRDELEKYKRAIAEEAVFMLPPSREQYMYRRPQGTDILYIVTATGGSFGTLKNLLLTYTAFNDVFLAMLPNNRRDNRYCQKLSDNFSVNQILRLNDQEELEQYLYRTTDSERIKQIKTNKRGDGQDSCRYFAVNFHALFYQGTVEIRWHGGTLDADEVLYWTALHQHILDKVLADDINRSSVIGLSSQVLLSDKVNSFFKILGIPSDSNMYKYVMQRIEFFTGNIK